MKKIISVIIGVFCFASFSHAAPLDLSSFSSQGAASISADEIVFTENLTDVAMYAYDNYFFVPGDAQLLSFDYELTYGAGDYDDYLTFEIDFVPVFEVLTPGSGNYIFDLSPYAGSTIDLAWGFIWGGDWDATSTGSISNIQLSSSASTPVPEPTTIVLMGGGLLGMAFRQAKRRWSA